MASAIILQSNLGVWGVLIIANVYSCSELKIRQQSECSRVLLWERIDLLEKAPSADKMHIVKMLDELLRTNYEHTPSSECKKFRDYCCADFDGRLNQKYPLLRSKVKLKGNTCLLKAVSFNLYEGSIHDRPHYISHHKELCCQNHCEFLLTLQCNDWLLFRFCKVDPSS